MMLSKMSPLLSNDISVPLLPDDIITDILSRLPVKSLLRSKCVSKFFLALISSSYFIKMHLNRSVQTKDNLCLLMWDDYLYHLNFDSIDDHDLPPTEVDYSPLRFKDGAILWGTSNGLVCMSNSLDTVYVWNPSTRKSIQLPFSPLERSKMSQPLSFYQERYFQERAYGFGYDEINDDYKVVRIVVLKRDFSGDPIDYEIKVYSLKTNSWHMADKFGYCPILCRTRDSIAGGAMHWISTVAESKSESERLLVAFDISTEKYRIIPQPKYNHGAHFCLYLDTLGECLSLSCHYYSLTVEVFVLKEYGRKNEHWSKIITLSPPNFSDPFHTVKTISYSKCGKKVLLDVDFKSLVWYNLEQGVVEGTRVHGTEQYFEVDTCFESLVSFNVPADVTITSAKNPKKEDPTNMKKFLSKGFKLVL
ncbi:F-box protein CPR1-like [Impatiens glandulifera]|uniref:F-box protein CPR1-like n=1 Tax=Impatiens glandulifera TaxID=253017 RepID=UPI001FB0915E|nr:F-box protein CPR1-like [Impatiens glandulifera]